jgi:hypothetical protein
MDALNLPLQSNKAGAAIWNEKTPKTPVSLADSLIPSMPSPLPGAPIQPQAVQPPSIKEDPMLEEVMRQAQTGLFALSRR